MQSPASGEEKPCAPIQNRGQPPAKKLAEKDLGILMNKKLNVIQQRAFVAKTANSILDCIRKSFRKSIRKSQQVKGDDTSPLLRHMWSAVPIPVQEICGQTGVCPVRARKMTLIGTSDIEEEAKRAGTGQMGEEKPQEILSMCGRERVRWTYGDAVLRLGSFPPETAEASGASGKRKTTTKLSVVHSSLVEVENEEEHRLFAIDTEREEEGQENRRNEKCHEIQGDVCNVGLNLKDSSRSDPVVGIAEISESVKNLKNILEERYRATGLGGEVTESSPVEKDWGVMIDEQLNMSQQHMLLNAYAQKASETLGYIKISVASRSREVILPLYSSLMTPHL
ncbi:hypothetical protein BTVI_06556 [Pitangus sulphuratus]|nr:hypothetical protein BTVI_06556 [Pitangus sulphuratus]